MKVIRIGLICLFSLTVVLFIITVFLELFKKDDTVPEILCDSPKIVMKLNDTEDKLLEGVRAVDEKDGDITDKIIVECISNFIEPGIARVTYAVADEDNHVVKYTRSVVYEDYVSPRFTLESDLVFQAGSTVNILNYLGAVDVIDGDISNKVRVTSSDLTTTSEGVYHIAAKISNSRGDSSELELPVYITARDPMLPVVELNEYIIYLPKGGTFEPNRYLKSVTAAGAQEPMEDPQVQVDSPINMMREGVYQVTYRAQDENGREGHAILTVVVEE